ncbi:MAG: hypothetical protein K2W96_07970 [Gemmataceae bacterium]|nr:hypothetical protein [Gemmataceae bacterium]
MAKPKKTVLFLCTGNYYRSRFAEILFDAVAGRMGLPWRAESRALALERGAGNVGPLSPMVLEALAERRLVAKEACARMPMPLALEDLQRADRVVALLESEHAPLLAERWPGWETKAEYWHVEDAPGALPLIEREVMGLVARLLTGAPRPPGPLPPEPVPRKKCKVGRETAGRRGKGVVTVFDTGLDEKGLAELAATLKARVGTGGTVKDGRVEIQGDQRDRVVAELEKLGYDVKRVGG